MLRWKRSRPHVVALTACILIFAACGGGGGDNDKASSTTTSQRSTHVDVRAAERGCQKAAPAAQHPGDDKDCDALADACGDHDWVACDRLFQVSDFGSEYETIGGTCAGSTTLDDRLASISQAGTQDPLIANEYCEQVVKKQVEAFLTPTTTSPDDADSSTTTTTSD